MKIEIDFSSPESMRGTRRELAMALAAVDSALATHGKDAGAPGPQPLISVRNPPPRAAVESAVVINGLGPTFTTRDARAAAQTAGLTEARFRNEIARQIKQGHLVEEEKGKGRKPTTYRRV